MRGTPFLIALIVVASVGVVSQPVAADDEWPDRCEDSQLIDPGQYTGTLTPSDIDAFQISITDGDYIDIELNWDEPGERLAFADFNRGDIGSRISVSSEENNATHDAGNRLTVFDPDSDGESSFRIYAETDGRICLALESYRADHPDWSMAFSTGDNEVPSLADSEDIQRLNQRVAELESQINQKNQRISNLESQLEQKNQTIIELESRVEELESQSSNESGNGDVTIDVTVNPANGQENFVEGGQAIVQAESESADVSDIQVEYGAGTYELGSSGEIAIPLAQTGTQEMTLVYGDTTEQVSIDVQAQADNQQDDSGASGDSQQDSAGENSNSDDGVSGVGPGFGIVAVVIALLGAALIIRRTQ